MRVLYVALAIVLPTPAHAICFQGYDLPTTLEYLACLHNEQNDVLDDHRRLLMEHTDVINDHARSVDDTNGRLRRATEEVEALSRRIEEQNSEIETLRDRVDALEAAQ